VTNRPGSKECYTRMLEYQNAMKARETAASAAALLSDCSTSPPLSSTSGGETEILARTHARSLARSLAVSSPRGLLTSTAGAGNTVGEGSVGVGDGGGAAVGGNASGADSGDEDANLPVVSDVSSGSGPPMPSSLPMEEVKLKFVHARTHARTAQRTAAHARTRSSPNPPRTGEEFPRTGEEDGEEFRCFNLKAGIGSAP
jgi:hypothetical protein